MTHLQRIACWILALVAWYPPGVCSADDAVFAEVVRPVFQQSCVKCHGRDGKVKGKVDLLEIGGTADLVSDLERLETIIEVLDEHEMPPEKEPELKPGVREQLVLELRKMLHAGATAEKGYAPTPIRRMNRFQYNNAVVDLLKLKVVVFPLPEKMMRDRSGYFRPETGKMPGQLVVSSRQLGKSALIEPRLAGVGPFPQDLRAEHGFDNRGDHLTLSPMLMEAFFKLSRRIVQSSNFDKRTVGIWQEFFVPPAEKEKIESEVRERLRVFLGRAFRQPVEKGLLESYVGYVMGQLKSGKEFPGAMKEAVSAVLASPQFLYLYDKPSEGNEAELLNGYELASRLSFFLWGSIPDDKLLELAGSGKLVEPEVLVEQVRRMLLDRKLKRFCDSFPAQWLQLERIISSLPDETIYRDFYYAPPNYRTSMDMMMEPLLLFETVLIENRSILEFIDSDYAYRTPRLRKWYGEPTKERLGGPVTLNFKRQPVSDKRHGGVITNAAVMTMTSGPDETKPITRGAWIAGVIFNDPPEPPPADVPPLEPQEEGAENLTIRERFAAHRERADCAGCHAKLDPLGFAFENFDPVGRWREKYENGRQVDASGTLFRRHRFSNVVEFKQAILEEKDRFTRAFAEHLLSFALGREITPADSPALDELVAQTISDDYRIRTLIEGVVQSAPFVSRSSGISRKTSSSGESKPAITEKQ